MDADRTPSLKLPVRGIVLLALPKGDFASLASNPPRNTAVRIVRGNRCRTKASLFREFASALDFPDYFGSNWDAFEECMNDLEWIPGRSLLILVQETEAILPEADPDLTTLLEILVEVAGRKVGKKVSVILQCPPHRESRLRSRLKGAGVQPG